MAGRKTAIPRGSDMARKNYTPAERALHILGALAGKSQEEINNAIAHGDAEKGVPTSHQKTLPKSSLDVLRRKYAPGLSSFIYSESMGDFAHAEWLPKPGDPYWGEFWEHCVRPKKMGDL